MEKKRFSVASKFFTDTAEPRTSIPFASAAQAISDKKIIVELPLSELHPFSGHVFKVRDDEDMAELSRSVAEYGVRQPVQVRSCPEGGYEIISGHRRIEASKRAGKQTVPAMIEEVDDDLATIIMVDTNLGQRQNLLTSEKAFAYRAKLEAIKRQGARTDGTLCQVGTKLSGFRADHMVAKHAEDSARTIQRYIRLTKLIPQLLEAVDSGRLKFNPAVIISYLKQEEQKDLWDYMEAGNSAPSLKQATGLKESSEQGSWSFTVLSICMSPTRSEPCKAIIRLEKLDPYWQRKTPKEAEREIIEYANTAAKLRQYTTLFPENISSTEFEQRLMRLVDTANKERMKRSFSFIPTDEK